MLPETCGGHARTRCHSTLPAVNHFVIFFFLLLVLQDSYGLDEAPGQLQIKLRITALCLIRYNKFVGFF